MVKSSIAFSSVSVHFLNVPDINECMVFRGLCANGRCRNTAEGFECDCNRGFAVDNLNTICTGKLRFQLMSLVVIVTEVFFLLLATSAPAIQARCASVMMFCLGYYGY